MGISTHYHMIEDGTVTIKLEGNIEGCSIFEQVGKFCSNEAGGRKRL